MVSDVAVSSGEETVWLIEAQGGEAAFFAADVSDGALDRLWLHYQELRRWNPTLSLVGPGTAGEIVERHYGEALAALPLLRPGPQVVIDAGSGAGMRRAAPSAGSAARR